MIEDWGLTLFTVHLLLAFAVGMLLRLQPPPWSQSKRVSAFAITWLFPVIGPIAVLVAMAEKEK